MEVFHNQPLSTVKRSAMNDIDIPYFKNIHNGLTCSMPLLFRAECHTLPFVARYKQTFNINNFHNCGGVVVILVHSLDSHAESPGSNPIPSPCTFVLQQCNFSTFLLSTQVYKWGPGRTWQIIVFEFASAIMTMCCRLL